MVTFNVLAKFITSHHHGNNSIIARYKLFNVSLVILNIINLSTFEQLRVVGGLILITQIIKEQNDVCFQVHLSLF